MSEGGSVTQEKSWYVEADWIDEWSGYRCVVARSRQNIMHRLKLVAVRSAQLKTEEGGQHVPGVHPAQ